MCLSLWTAEGGCERPKSNEGSSWLSLSAAGSLVRSLPSGPVSSIRRWPAGCSAIVGPNRRVVPQPMRLLEAVVEPAQPGAAPSAALLVLRLPGGSQVEIAEAKQIPLVAALVRELAKPC